MDPTVVCGSYTPEEIGDYKPVTMIATAQTKEEANAEDVPCAVQEEPAGQEGPTEDAPVAAGNASEKEPPQPAAKGMDQDGFATREQVQRIKGLFDALAVPPEAREAALARRGANALHSLAQPQAGDLIAALEARHLAGQSRAREDATSSRVTDPCTQPQVDQIKSLVAELAQHDAGLPAKIRAKLEQSGLQKLADLSIAEADQLLTALRKREAEIFFDCALRGWKQP